MELREFINDALTQIMLGVSDAQKAVAKSQIGGIISPPIQTDWEKTGYVFTTSGTPVQKVDFDVAVTIGEKTATKGTIGIIVASFGLGSQGESANSTSSESRIKFSVPIALPVTHSTSI